MTFNWGVWLAGLISALSDAVLIGLGMMAFIPGQTTIKQMALVCAVPAIKGFFTYLKQCPLPIVPKPLPGTGIPTP